MDLRLITRLSFGFILTSLVVHAQTDGKLTINGVVMSDRAVDAADCFLKHNEYIGTITNASGYFNLEVPHALRYDTLVILAMGFDKKEVPVSSLPASSDTIRLFLDENPVMLEEIVVESDGLDLKNLVLKAMANVRRNYPDKRHQLAGLYRKFSTKGATYTHLEEAVILIEDYNYHRPLSSVKIASQNFRQTKDWSDIDSLRAAALAKMGRTIAQHLGQASNPLTRLYGRNPIRHFDEANTWFNFESRKSIIEKYYTFQLMDIFFSKSDTIYQIAFAANARPPRPTHASGRNYLMINNKDYAIVEMQLTLGFDNEPLWAQEYIKFEKKQGKYYPKLIRTIDRRHTDRNMDEDAYDIRMYWFDEPETERFQRIRSTELVDPNDPQSHKRSAYDKEFWDTTTFIKKFPLNARLKEDLEKHGTLDAQFRSE